MFNLVVLSALLAVAAAAPGLIPAPVAYNAAVVGSVPTSVSHQSSSVVHSAALTAPIVAPASPVIAPGPSVISAYSAPVAAAPSVISAYSAPSLISPYSAFAPHAYSAPVIGTHGAVVAGPGLPYGTGFAYGLNGNVVY